jgi:PPOX class probable F420-dependent enzyme
MPLEIDDRTFKFIRDQRVARLATADGDGRPSVIPICYVLDEGAIYSPIDEKPKRVGPRALKRIRNIESNPHVSIVVDEYYDDWSRLSYVLIRGLAEIIGPTGARAAEHARAVSLLREKYPQYRTMAIDERPLIKIVPDHVKHWSSATMKTYG